MENEFGPAIAALERRLEDAERKANELRGAINVLCAEAGLPPRYPEGDGSKPRRTITQIKDDTFYGKKHTPAMREYLDMRKAQGLGPATPREIFDALKQGGCQFDAKNDDVALVGLRALLRKQPQTFHRLPQGTYGLTSWYDDIKKPKQTEPDTENEAAAKQRSAAAELREAQMPRKRGRPPKNPGRKEVPDAAHRPDLNGPVKTAEVA